MIRAFLILLMLSLLQSSLFAMILHTGHQQPYKDLTTAAKIAIPGDTILVYGGIYPGQQSLQHLQGTPQKWIYIIAKNRGAVFFEGGATAWTGSDIAYLHIEGFVFSKQTANGVNFDDGGSYSSPAHHIVLKDCIFRDLAATGNNDLVKLSGMDDFSIEQCTFLNGSSGGSGIDMVGCHRGVISHCRFESMGSNALQMKGGSSDIQVEACVFKNAGGRAINLGGSTGKEFFRPLNAAWEASGLKVYSNVFIGSEVPVAFVGCTKSEVVNNTIYKPGRWVIRILQENRDTLSFGKCGDNTFSNNVICINQEIRTVCSIGVGTRPESFTFSNNAWYHIDNSSWTGAKLPVVETRTVLGKDPLFRNPAREDFTIAKNSPLAGAGMSLQYPEKDNVGKSFKLKRAIGAFELK